MAKELKGARVAFITGNEGIEQAIVEHFAKVHA
jgi:hypothetical protein